MRRAVGVRRAVVIAPQPPGCSTGCSTGCRHLDDQHGRVVVLLRHHVRCFTPLLVHHVRRRWAVDARCQRRERRGGARARRGGGRHERRRRRREYERSTRLGGAWCAAVRRAPAPVSPSSPPRYHCCACCATTAGRGPAAAAELRQSRELVSRGLEGRRLAVDGGLGHVDGDGERWGAPVSRGHARRGVAISLSEIEIAGRWPISRCAGAARRDLAAARRDLAAARRDLATGSAPAARTAAPASAPAAPTPAAAAPIHAVPILAALAAGALQLDLALETSISALEIDGEVRLEPADVPARTVRVVVVLAPHLVRVSVRVSVRVRVRVSSSPRAAPPGSWRSAERRARHRPRRPCLRQR